MNIWQLERQFIDRWAAQVPGLHIASTFEPIDWTQADPLKVCAQVVFEGIEEGGKTRAAAIVPLRYSAIVFLDLARMDTPDKLLAGAVLDGAICAATGWECAPGQFSRVDGGQRTLNDGCILQVAVSFVLPTISLSIN